MMRLTLVLLCLFISHPLMSQSKKVDEGDSQSVEVVYEDEGQVQAQESFTEPIERLFKNPALANGLASGADAINRSVESLMDAVFYSLLDNELRWNVNDEAWFALTAQRDLFSTNSGAYVIVERVSLGPRYERKLGEIAQLPVSLGADGSVEVMQIYLRTDGMRVAEQAELPWWRRTINNWFGLLPIGSLLLPPSFNPNELYDPMKQLETPFSFPLAVDTFYDMQVGSIRSYNISGGVRLSMDLSGGLDGKSKEALEKLEGLVGTAPYSVFRRGENRINVLRRNENIAWVGLAKVDRTGHAVDLEVGNRVFILKGALAATLLDNKFSWVWGGIPGLLAPLDSHYEQAIADVFDQVYEYDLRNPHAQEAYLAAVRGDFTVSQMKYREAYEKKAETGVLFHFTRNQKRREKISEDGPNFTVFKSSREVNLRDAEIEITDQEGKFYVLEAREGIADRDWDVIVGEEKRTIDQVLEIKVQRLINKEMADAISDPEAIVFGDKGFNQDLDEDEFMKAPLDGKDIDEVSIDEDTTEEEEEPEKFYYVLASDEDPIQMNLNYEIQDRYVTAEEYEEYLNDLRFVTNLPIKDIPEIGHRDGEDQMERRRKVFFSRPEHRGVRLHVTPTHLGRFAATATMNINTEQLDRILARTDDQMWAAFARVFGKDVGEWGDPAQRDTLGFNSQWFTAFLALPFRLLNMRWEQIDAIEEITDRVNALKNLRKAAKPIQKMRVAYDLFNTHYPKQLMRALLDLAEETLVPRQVSLVAEPKGQARHTIKNLFQKANGRVFKAGPPFPKPGRYARAKKTLSAFHLNQPMERMNKPVLKNIKVSKRGNDIYLHLGARNMKADSLAKIYVRVAQAGKVKIGKLELAEEVLRLMPIEQAKGKVDLLSYEFFLTGDKSPLANFVYDQMVDSGGDFEVKIALSREGVIWSDEKNFKFRLEEGRLAKP